MTSVTSMRETGRSCSSVNTMKDKEPGLVQFNREPIINVFGVVVCFFLCSSAITLCSSNYSGPGSRMDAVVITYDVAFIDVMSALFVLSGFTWSWVYVNTPKDDFTVLQHYGLLSLYIDLTLSSVLSVLIGSIYNLINANFHALDVIATLIEGFTGVRCLDYSQDKNHWHSLNVASWPVQSLMWCIITAKATYTFNAKITERFGARGYYIISVLSIFGVLIFTIFGVMHSDTNIFYSNATSFTYRTMEFNLGLHFYFLVCQDEVCSHVLWGFLHHFRGVIYMLFVCIWWSEVGVAVSPFDENEEVCLRLYYMNNCLPGHHVFMLRGCILGLAMITSLPDMADQVEASVVHMIPTARALCTAISFCWPVYMTTKIVLDISFGKDAVNSNRALVAIIMPFIGTAFAFLYDSLVKTHLLDLAVCAYAQMAVFFSSMLGRPYTTPVCEPLKQPVAGLDGVDEI